MSNYIIPDLLKIQLYIILSLNCNNQANCTIVHPIKQNILPNTHMYTNPKTNHHPYLTLSLTHTYTHTHLHTHTHKHSHIHTHTHTNTHTHAHTQYDCINTLNDQLLENVTVQMDTGDDCEVIAYIPIESLPYDKLATCYTLVKLSEDPASGLLPYFLLSTLLRVLSS